MMRAHTDYTGACLGPVMDPENGARYCPFNPDVECEDCEDMRVLVTAHQYEDSLIEMAMEAEHDEHIH